MRSVPIDMPPLDATLVSVVDPLDPDLVDVDDAGERSLQALISSCRAASEAGGVATGCDRIEHNRRNGRCGGFNHLHNFERCRSRRASRCVCDRFSRVGRCNNLGRDYDNRHMARTIAARLLPFAIARSMVPWVKRPTFLCCTQERCLMQQCIGY